MGRVLPETARGKVIVFSSFFLILLVLFFVVGTARLFLWPPTDQPQRSDAVVALGGDPGQLRAKQALSLARQGYAPVAVISLGGTAPAPCPTAPPHVSVICFRADPLDTRGEAEFVGRLVAARHWHRIMVVSERTQTTRARLLFERCTDVHLAMVPVTDPSSHLLYDVVYEWGALGKALLLERSC
ncbi:MAG: YdcF family protein [Acidimicrobiales bacterium]|nr:YdcF family protein [Acidimicrobiales bacterium]